MYVESEYAMPKINFASGASQERDGVTVRRVDGRYGESTREGVHGGDVLARENVFSCSVRKPYATMRDLPATKWRIEAHVEPASVTSVGVFLDRL